MIECAANYSCKKLNAFFGTHIPPSKKKTEYPLRVYTLMTQKLITRQPSS